MTAVMPEVDLTSLTADLHAVFTEHGITGADVSARHITQSGERIGLTVSGLVLPSTQPGLALLPGGAS